MEIKRCMNCMEELSENNGICPACGTDKQTIEQPNYALQCGAMLHGRYLVGKVLGQGGFGAGRLWDYLYWPGLAF